MSYLSFDDRLELGLADFDDMPDEQTSLLDAPLEPVMAEAKVVAAAVAPIAPTIVAPVSDAASKKAAHRDESAPMCYNCGNQTQKAGSCYVCTSCGSTTGCS